MIIGYLLGNKYFKVSEFYVSLSSTFVTSFPWKFVWRSKIPPRVAFFSWTIALGKILTLENLWYKGVAVIDWCYMCKKSGELVTHSVFDLFLSWQGFFGGHKSIDLWRIVPHCVLWCI